MTNGTPPRPPPLPRLDQVRPIEERFAPPPNQRTGPPRSAPPGHRPPAQNGAPPQRPKTRHRRRSGIGTALILAALGLGAAAAAGVGFVLMAPPTDLIRDQAIAFVKARTGRDLVIAGPAQLSLYPTFGASLKSVSLSAPPGMGGTPTVTIESLDVAVNLLALLGRKVEVSRLVLTRPNFDLRVDAQGRRNWELATVRNEPRHVRLADNRTAGPMSDAVSEPATRLAQRAPDSAHTLAGAAGGTARHGLDDLVLGDVRIVDGSLTYSDARTGAAQSVSSLDVAIKARSIASPLAASGDLEWRGQKVGFDGSLTTLQDVIGERPARLALTVSAKPLEAVYSGAIDVRDGASFDGTIEAKTASLRALALWLGQTLPANDGFGAASVSGRLKAKPGAFRLDNTDMMLDAMRINGDIAGTTGSGRPKLTAQLKLSELDLNTYLGGGIGVHGAPTASTPAASTAPNPPATAPMPAPQSIEDLLERQPGPRVKGYSARAGWSDEPIDTSLLGLADVDAKLSVGQLRFRDIKLGQSDLVLALADRIAKTTFERVQLYQGSGRGFLTIDASAGAPRFALSSVIENVAAGPLLNDAAAIDWLSGTGKLTLATTSQGASQRQLVSSLDGKATIAFSDGAVRGFDVAKAVRGLNQGRFANLSLTPSEKTDFSQLSASFDIAQGIASNTDLTMLSPILRVTGSGRIDLPQRQLDYTVRPKLVEDLAGQGGSAALAGLEVPIRITGPWVRPEIAPDLSKIDSGKAIQAVEEIGKKLKGKDAGEVVDELFGKDSKESQKAKKLLDKLFR